MIKKTPAIAGTAICGITICGDDSKESIEVSSSDIDAIIQITTSDGYYVYTFPIISGNITLNQPFTDDGATITLVHNGQIEMGSDVSIQFSKGVKKIVFEGIIRTENKRKITSQGNILSELICTSNFDGLNHRYLEEGNQTIFHSSIKESINQFIEIASLNIENNSDNETDIIDLEFEIWNKNLLDILNRIIATKCYMYLNKDKLIIDDISDNIVYKINKNSKIISIDNETTQMDSYKRCFVQGNEVSAESVDEEATSNKVLYIKDNSILTIWDAKTRANQELKTHNEQTDAITITLANLTYPDFGNIEINLPGISKILELKSIQYNIGENGLNTILYLGRSYKSLRSIFKELKK